MRSALMEPEPYAMSSRSPQLPAVTSVQDGVAKHASTPSFLATSFVASASKPSTWFAGELVHGALGVSRAARRPRTSIDCGGYPASW